MSISPTPDSARTFFQDVQKLEGLDKRLTQLTLAETKVVRTALGVLKLGTDSQQVTPEQLTVIKKKLTGAELEPPSSLRQRLLNLGRRVFGLLIDAKGLEKEIRATQTQVAPQPTPPPQRTVSAKVAPTETSKEFGPMTFEAFLKTYQQTFQSNSARLSLLQEKIDILFTDLANKEVTTLDNQLAEVKQASAHCLLPEERELLDKMIGSLLEEPRDTIRAQSNREQLSTLLAVRMPSLSEGKTEIGQAVVDLHTALKTIEGIFRSGQQEGKRKEVVVALQTMRTLLLENYPYLNASVPDISSKLHSCIGEVAAQLGCGEELDPPLTIEWDVGVEGLVDRVLTLLEESAQELLQGVVSAEEERAR